MRRKDPLIVGAGPAGCAAAIVLARAGARPLLVDREAQAGDVLCGGFLGWRTVERLRELGLDPATLGAHAVERLVLYGPGRPLKHALHRRAWGLSRKALDTRLRELAIAAGAEFAVETVREIDGLSVVGRDRQWETESLFLATGKHDVRGAARPRDSRDPTLGLRLRLRPSPGLARRLAGKIELHLFDRGYGGIVLQEDGSANVCLALRKSLLAEHGGEPHRLLAALATGHPHFALRLEADWRDVRVDTIGSVPYGWSTGQTNPGLFRLGDQAAVIPSLAGEGIDIAVTSGIAAARAWLVGGADAAPGFQAGFHQQVRAPMEWAGTAWRLVERPYLAGPALAAARLAPSLLTRLISATRVD
jgi:flavin-dependent dehydrogenase